MAPRNKERRSEECRWNVMEQDTRTVFESSLRTVALQSHSEMSTTVSMERESKEQWPQLCSAFVFPAHQPSLKLLKSVTEFVPVDRWTELSHRGNDSDFNNIYLTKTVCSQRQLQRGRLSICSFTQTRLTLFHKLKKKLQLVNVETLLTYFLLAPMGQFMKTLWTFSF